MNLKALMEDTAPKRQRRPQTVRLLVDHDAISDGTPLVYAPSTVEELAIGAWLDDISPSQGELGERPEDPHPLGGRRQAVLADRVGLPDVERGRLEGTVERGPGAQAVEGSGRGDVVVDRGAAVDGDRGGGGAGGGGVGVAPGSACLPWGPWPRRTRGLTPRTAWWAALRADVRERRSGAIGQGKPGAQLSRPGRVRSCGTRGAALRRMSWPDANAAWVPTTRSRLQAGSC